MPEAEQQELLGVLAPMHDEIVEVHPGDRNSAPESYQEAPALG